MRQDSKVELNIASNPESLPEVRTAAEQMARQEGFGDADAHRLVLAIDEALANVIKHGYEGRPDQPITITLEKAKSAEGRVGIAVTVRDQGRQVDPKTIKGRPLDDILIHSSSLCRVRLRLLSFFSSIASRFSFCSSHDE